MHVDAARARDSAWEQRPTTLPGIVAIFNNVAPGREAEFEEVVSARTSGGANPCTAPVTDTNTTATNRNRDSSANPLNPAPITSSGNGIHKLLNGLRYAGHELPEFLRSGHRREPCNGAGDGRLQSQLCYSATVLQAILRSRAVVPAVNRTSPTTSSLSPATIGVLSSPSALATCDQGSPADDGCINPPSARRLSRNSCSAFKAHTKFRIAP